MKISLIFTFPEHSVLCFDICSRFTRAIFIYEIVHQLCVYWCRTAIISCLPIVLYLVNLREVTYCHWVEILVTEGFHFLSICHWQWGIKIECAKVRLKVLPMEWALLIFAISRVSEGDEQMELQCGRSKVILRKSNWKCRVGESNVYIYWSQIRASETRAIGEMTQKHIWEEKSDAEWNQILRLQTVGEKIDCDW